MLLCSALLAIPAGPASLPGAVRQRCLANGLDVILLRVEGAPLVSVWSGVRAGSADERPGITGAAHWCARMAFKGTERYEPGRMHELLERAGAAWNACTWLDQTCFFGTLPKGALDLVLDIEAQRMAAALFLPETVETERAAIISELQTLENDPEKLLDIETTAAAFAAHPYRWPAIGRRRDVEKTTREELYRFYRRAYCPSNATLVVAGDFDEEQTLRSIRRAFGALPPGEPLEPSRTEELAQRGERRVQIERGGETACLQLLYRTPAVGDRDVVPLLVLNAALGGADTLTAHGAEWRGPAARSSRLHRGLVETGLASKAGSLFIPTKQPFVFCVYATAARGVDPARLEEAAVRVMEEAAAARLGEAEFRKAVNGLRARFIYDCEGGGGGPQMLGYYATIGDASFPWAFLKELDRVSAEDVRAAAERNLTKQTRTVGWNLPSGEAGGGRRPVETGRGPADYRDDASAPAFAAFPRRRSGVRLWPWGDNGAGGAEAPPAAAAAAPGPALGAVRTVLPNGLVLVVRENRSSPTIAARVDIAAGSSFDPAGKAGLAQFTARMLDRGSRAMSAALLAEVMDSTGTELGISCERDRASLSVRMLRGKLPLVAELLSQMLREPVFPAAEVEMLRGALLAEIQEDARDAAAAAVDRAYELIYPHGHPYRHRVAGDARSVGALRREDLARFFEARYSPRTTTIVISGDVAPEEAAAAIEAHFGSWETRGVAGAANLMAPPLPVETKWEMLRFPGGSEAEIVVGSRGVAWNNPDRCALQLMNHLLGGFGTGGRLTRLLREGRDGARHLSSAFIPYRGAGVFLVRAGVNPEKAAEAVREIRNELLGMKGDGAAEAELLRSREALVNAVPRVRETNAGVADALAEMEFFRLGLDYLERCPGLFAAVTEKEVRRVAHEYLHPDNLVIVVAGPVE